MPSMSKLDVLRGTADDIRVKLVIMELRGKPVWHTQFATARMKDRLSAIELRIKKEEAMHNKDPT